MSASIYPKGDLVNLIGRLSERTAGAIRAKYLKGDKYGSRATHNIYKKIKIIQEIESFTAEQKRINVYTIFPDYAFWLDKGRNPTSENAAKGEPSLYQIILKWCERRGIETEAAGAITAKIHRDGYKGTKFLDPLRALKKSIIEGLADFEKSTQQAQIKKIIDLFKKKTGQKGKTFPKRT